MVPVTLTVLNPMRQGTSDEPRRVPDGQQTGHRTGGVGRHVLGIADWFSCGSVHKNIQELEV